MNVPSGLKAILPRGALDQRPNDGAAGLARRHTADRQLRRWISSTFAPFDYQSDVIDGLCDRSRAGSVVGMLMMPTGSGKTSTVAAYVLGQLEAHRGQGGACLWIAPQHELLTQAAAAFETVWSSGYGPNSLDLTMMTSSWSSPPVGRSMVIFATPMMAARRLTPSSGSAAISHFIFDEAHHLGAERFGGSWRDIIESSDSLESALGLSATPIRGDHSTFDDLQAALDSRLFYPKRLLPDPVGQLVDRGVLAAISIKRVRGIPADMCSASMSSRDANRALVSDPDYWMACIGCAAEFQAPLIVYCFDTDSGWLFAQHLRAIGVRAEFIDGSDSYDVRVSVLERFRDGKTSVIVSVNLLFEGVDAPSAAGALITYRIQSTIRLSQIVGRVMRGSRLGGTATATIFCADPVVERQLRINGTSQDYGAYWKEGVAL